MSRPWAGRLIAMSELTITMADGEAEAIVAGSAGPGVLLYMDAIGLRPELASMTERIAAWGYVVMAPNVFYRAGSVAALAPTRDLREPGAAAEFFTTRAMARVRALAPDRLAVDAPRYLDALAARPGVSEPFGVVGYCMGARLAVRTAALAPTLIAACGGFHGGGLVTDDPASPHRLVDEARAEFLFGHADGDRSLTPQHAKELDESLAAAGRRFASAIYPEARHGFTMPDLDAYQEAGAERSLVELRALFDRVLRGDR